MGSFMNYVCKNCGKLITEEEYNNSDNSGMGCLMWLIFIFLCVSVVLIPIALILLFMHYNKNSDNNICPYCKAKGSLIPEDTPIAQTILRENIIPEEQSSKEDDGNVEEQRKNSAIFLCNSDTRKNIEQYKKGPSVFFWILFVFIGIGLYNAYQDMKYEKPKDASDIKCNNYKSLCIADYDIKYLAERDNSPYYNGLLGASNACKTWGGRLPYKSELLILKDAFNEKVIKRSTETRLYLSGTSYGADRVYILNMTDTRFTTEIDTVEKYLKPQITPYGLSKPTPDQYDFAARCVKPIKK